MVSLKGFSVMKVEVEAIEFIYSISDGDAHVALNVLEIKESTLKKTFNHSSCSHNTINTLFFYCFQTCYIILLSFDITNMDGDAQMYANNKYFMKYAKWKGIIISSQH